MADAIQVVFYKFNADYCVLSVPVFLFPDYLISVVDKPVNIFSACNGVSEKYGQSPSVSNMINNGSNNKNDDNNSDKDRYR